MERYAPWPNASRQLGLFLFAALATNASVMAGVIFSIVPLGLKPGRTPRRREFLCHD